MNLLYKIQILIVILTLTMGISQAWEPKGSPETLLGLVLVQVGSLQAVKTTRGTIEIWVDPWGWPK